jgi:hypothetical protein
MPETQLSQIRKSFPDPVSVMGSREVRSVMQASMRSSQKAAGSIRDQIGFQRLTGHWLQAYDIRPMQLFSAAKEFHGHANVGPRAINLMRAGSAQRRTRCLRAQNHWLNRQGFVHRNRQIGRARQVVYSRFDEREIRPQLIHRQAFTAHVQMHPDPSRNLTRRGFHE